ncbi:MAG: alternative ribosome rescue aminoacyl-tRNA hydrolase ArfB, partial [Bacteroidota bacterium]
MPEVRVAGILIPTSSLRFRTARSSGPGGQNVNKLDTRVEVVLEVESIPGLTHDQRALLQKRLGSRLDRTGALHVISQRHRSQWQNKVAALERLVELLETALTPERERRATRPTKASVRRRHAHKRNLANKKSSRRRPAHDDD